MARVLITGMSGAGKTTVLAELARRGYPTVDTDYDGWVLSSGDWDEPRMADLLAASSSVVVAGTVANQRRFYEQFSAVVLLAAPVEVLIERIAHRTNNPYGTSEAEQLETRNNVVKVEPALRATSTLELDGRLSVNEFAGAIQRLVDET